MRSWVAFVLALACSSQGPETPPAETLAPSDKLSGRDAGPQASVEHRPDAPAAPTWTFAVLSDLHLPNYRRATVELTVKELVAMKVRFVVITGDHTNGSPLDGPRRRDDWWEAVTSALQPLRDAGIPVLPVAGNHDSYLPAQRAGYAGAFADLAWAKPLVVRSGSGAGELERWPFSYSVDVDGVHLSLIHLVATKLHPEVARWLDADLASDTARSARHRIVFGHVPLSSVIWSPDRLFVAELGDILERGRVGMFAAGHEHVVWDEDVALPKGGKLRQLIVGCASGYYHYPPSEPAKLRAQCAAVNQPGKREPMRCKMPNGGGAFEIARGRKNRHLQHYTSAFVLVDVDGDQLRVRPMTTEPAGRLRPFYLTD